MRYIRDSGPGGSVLVAIVAALVVLVIVWATMVDQDAMSPEESEVELRLSTRLLGSLFLIGLMISIVAGSRLWVALILVVMGFPSLLLLRRDLRGTVDGSWSWVLVEGVRNRRSLLGRIIYNFLHRSVTSSINRGYEKISRRLAFVSVRLFPRDPRAWTLLVRAKANFRHLEEAEATARDALRRLPDEVELKASLAFTLFGQGKVDEVRHLMEEAVRQHPESCYPYRYLIRIARREGRIDDAKALLEEGSTKIDGDGDQVVVDHSTHLGIEAAQLPGSKARAIELLQRAVRSTTSDPRPFVALSVLLESEDQEQAGEHLMTARYLWVGSGSSFEEFVRKSRRGLLREPS